MTPTALMPSPSRVTMLFAALVCATLPSAHAAARNHDVQTIRIPAATPFAHDRAPGPSAR